MVADTFDIVDEFSSDGFLKLFRQIIDRAGKHEVLPHHQAQLVAGIPEAVIGVIPAAPDADAVEISILCLLQQRVGSFRSHP